MLSEKAVPPIGPGPGSAPVAVCDICGEQITKPGLAMYVWDSRALTESGQTTDFILVHKGVCREVAERHIGFDGYADHEFTHLLRALIRNSNA